MGREFLKLFDDWAKTYDASVSGFDPQYRAVFKNYEGILNEVVKNCSCGGVTIEFGVGTGNLSKQLMQAEHDVIGIEPSKAMLEIAREKLPELKLMEGDFITFPKLPSLVDNIVSTYAFHHLTDDEKGIAIKHFVKILSANGKVVFGDTMFKSEADKKLIIKEAKDKGFTALAEDLQREYYPTIDVVRNIFHINNFDVMFKQMNDFVWIVVAKLKSD